MPSARLVDRQEVEASFNIENNEKIPVCTGMTN